LIINTRFAQRTRLQPDDAARDRARIAITLASPQRLEPQALGISFKIVHLGLTNHKPPRLHVGVDLPFLEQILQPVRIADARWTRSDQATNMVARLHRKQGMAYPLASRRKRCVDGHDGRDNLDPFNTLRRGEGEKFPQAVQGVDQKSKLRSTIGVKVLGHIFDLVGRVQIDDTQCITCLIDAMKSTTVIREEANDQDIPLGGMNAPDASVQLSLSAAFFS
jgi:hypothetical protein